MLGLVILLPATALGVLALMSRGRVDAVAGWAPGPRYKRGFGR